MPQKSIPQPGCSILTFVQHVMPQRWPLERPFPTLPFNVFLGGFEELPLQSSLSQGT